MHMLSGWVNSQREQHTVPQGSNIEPAQIFLHANGNPSRYDCLWSEGYIVQVNPVLATSTPRHGISQHILYIIYKKIYVYRRRRRAAGEDKDARQREQGGDLRRHDGLWSKGYE